MLQPAARDAGIERVAVCAYTIPTDFPESDGTLEWDSTTLVVVRAAAGAVTGLGYSYASTASARLIKDLLAETVQGRPAMAVADSWSAMRAAVRNLGYPGVAAMAIAAVDVALWDLKARLLGLPLVALLGSVREEIPAYGSGGFTSYDAERLHEQLGTWVAQGIRRVKMKVGRDASADVARVRGVRRAIGPAAELFVDANGAYSRKQALAMADAFADEGVTWFEEPVSSDDLEGLRLLRDRVPAPIAITAGEYGYDVFYFRRMLEAGAVDILQADATRCAGITGFLAAGALCQAHAVPLSSHTAPSLHVHLCCALPAARNAEWFHDHARIERLLFDGAPTPVDGALRPDRSRPGLGLELKDADAQRYDVEF